MFIYFCKSSFCGLRYTQRLLFFDVRAVCIYGNPQGGFEGYFSNNNLIQLYEPFHAIAKTVLLQIRTCEIKLVHHFCKQIQCYAKSLTTVRIQEVFMTDISVFLILFVNCIGAIVLINLVDFIKEEKIKFDIRICSNKLKCSFRSKNIDCGRIRCNITI